MSIKILNAFLSFFSSPLVWLGLSLLVGLFFYQIIKSFFKGIIILFSLIFLIVILSQTGWWVSGFKWIYQLLKTISIFVIKNTFL